MGEIADGDPVRLPDPATVFRQRSQRLLVLSEGHELQGFLRMIAAVMAAQHAALDGLPPGAPDDVWRDALRAILDTVDPALLPDAARQVRDELKAASPEELKALADHFLAGEVAAGETARLVFVVAALQVAWTQMAARLDKANVRISEQHPGLCPVCASPPVAGVIEPGGTKFGHRHLHCSLCATQWRHVRVRCVHCGSTDKVSFRQIAGTTYLRAECCESCRGYSKVFYVEKARAVEPFADDLASLGLDLMVGEEGFSRVANPFVLGDGTEH
ncbi:MAG: formate dehydrogenase accessory protein FdhE [Reyranella sp.]|uniref:formate dehydrogenase accessory protein FdhE n=1 Tax=Reyranella sp. TaxID=1929291 RepID=UPI001AD0EB43|nr:formate dehydrogenase accessory protein FdhE [Reyranella sp.]MBN9091546.1 formate dehydrogenase accessory protein FdhE [Reyranella sp.]